MVSGPSPNTCDVVELTFKNSCELPGVQLVGCTTLLVLATGSAVLAGTLTCTVAVLPSESVTISVSIPTGAEIVKVYGALPDGFTLPVAQLASSSQVNAGVPFVVICISPSCPAQDVLEAITENPDSGWSNHIGL